MQNLCWTFDPSPEGVVSCKLWIIGWLTPLLRVTAVVFLYLREGGVTIAGDHIKRKTAIHTNRQNLILNLPQWHVFGLREEGGVPERTNRDTGIESTTFCMAGNSSSHCTSVSPCYFSWLSEDNAKSKCKLGLLLVPLSLYWLVWWSPHIICWSMKKAHKMFWRKQSLIGSHNKGATSHANHNRLKLSNNYLNLAPLLLYHQH